jgi:hypothetical protein
MASDFDFDGAELTASAITAERMRAHFKHGDDSMEGKPWDDKTFWAVLVEEVGEVARVFCELRHGHITVEQAREQAAMELIQVAAMASVWAQACDTPEPAT